MTLRLVNRPRSSRGRARTAGWPRTDRAVAAAKGGVPRLADGRASDRARLPSPVAGLIEIIARNSPAGKRKRRQAIADSRGEIAMVAEVFHYYAAPSDKHSSGRSSRGRVWT